MKNTAHLHIVLTEDLKKKLEEEARKRGLGISTYVRTILMAELKKE